MTKEQKWLLRAKETYKYHRERLLGDDKWTLTQTATILRRSLGGVSEDILIARYHKKHPIEIDKFDYAYEALKWIRDVQKASSLEEIE